MKTFITQSDIETQRVAFNLAQKYRNGVIALVGELGAGKTTFTQGFARGLGIKDKIISPTFVLIRQHLISKTKRLLYHIDLYRLEKDFNELGLTDLFKDLNALILIEWAEKIKDLLPKNTIWIYFKIIKNNKREIKIS